MIFTKIRYKQLYGKTDSYLVGILPEYNFRFLLADCSNSVREVIQRHEMEHSSTHS